MALVEITSRLLRTYSWDKVRLFFHTIVTFTYIGLYSYAGYIAFTTDLLSIPNKFIENGKANVFNYFSVWAMVAETIFFWSYSVIDAIEMHYLLNKKPETASSLRLILKSLVQNILFSIVFPLSTVVATLFWVFYSIDRELIYPALIDNYFAPIMNHIVHTYPVPLSILYMFLDVKEEPPKWKSFKILTVVMSIYSLVFIHANSNNNNTWIYPALDPFTFTQAVMILTLAVVSTFVSLFLGYFIFSRIKDLRSYLFETVKKLKTY